MKNIEEILIKKGGMLSSDLSLELQNTLGISSSASRKRISRAILPKNSPIKYLLDLNFPHNTRFIYHRAHGKNEIFFENLYEALNKTGSTYAHAINTLIAKNGVMEKERFKALSGSPDKIKGHLSYTNILQRLLETNICRETNINGESCIFLEDEHMKSEEYAYAQSKVEEILISALKDWLKKMCLVSFKAVDNKNEFGSFGWDITSPSYTMPIGCGSKPGFVVVDVIFNQIDENCIKYFLHKVSILKAQKGIYPFMPIIVASYFTPEAYNLGKSKGVILTTPEILFGESTSKAFKKLLHNLANAGAVASNNLNEFMELFDQLAKIKGASLNLAGDLLEFITAHCVRQIAGGSVDIGKKISYLGESNNREIDVMLMTGTNKVYFYECKGYNKKNLIEEYEIAQWLDKIQYIRNWIKNARNDLSNRETFFEFITTSDFTPEAKALLERAANAKRYTVSYKNGKEFANFINESNLNNKTKILKTLEEHYFNNPI